MNTTTSWEQLLAWATEIQSPIAEGPTATSCDRQAARAHLARNYDFRKAVAPEALLKDLTGFLQSGVVQTNHPGYLGFFNPSASEVGVAADFLAAALNPQLATSSHAAVPILLEEHVLAYLGAKLGLRDFTASFTTGGSEANLNAMQAALTARWPDRVVLGLSSWSRKPVLYCSDVAHDSILKAAQISGLGASAVRRVQTTADQRMDIVDLRRQLDRDSRRKFAPFMVVATAGTTAAGAIDPLPELRALTRSQDLWLHVDAAWGGLAALSPSRRHLLSGIEAADSVTWDAHKTLPVPVGAGMLFCRQPEPLHASFRVGGRDYMPAMADGYTEPFRTTAQWSRRFTGLKVFAVLAALGEEGLRDMVDRMFELGDELRQRLTDRGWRIVNDTRLPVLCFTHPRLEGNPSEVRRVVRSLQAEGRLWISDVRISDQTVLRACICNHRTRSEHLLELVTRLDGLVQTEPSTGRRRDCCDAGAATR